jgi:hypothetical protein
MTLQLHSLWQNDVIFRTQFIHKKSMGMTTFKNIDLSYMGDVRQVFIALV